MSATSLKIEQSIKLGIYVESGDPDLEDLVKSITPEQIAWISIWLAGEGFRAPIERKDRR